MGDTHEEIIRLVCLALGRREARPEDRILEDLGAESADVANILAALEDKYGIYIPEDEIPNIRTIADLQALVDQRM